MAAVMAGLALAAPSLRADDVGDLGNANADVREAAIKKLAEKGSEATSELVAGLTHEQARVREQCCRLLGQCKAEAGLDGLIRLVSPASEKVESVRVAAILGLAKIEQAGRNDSLGGLLLDRLDATETSFAERYALASTLAALKYERARSRFEGWLKPGADGNAALGECAVRFFAGLSGGRGHEVLVSFVRNDTSKTEGEKTTTTWAFDEGKWAGVRALAVLELVAAKHRDAPALLAQTISRDRKLDELTLEALARKAPSYGETAIEALMAVVRDKEQGGIHAKAVQVLSGMGRPALDAMIKLMREGIAQVKFEADAGRTIPNPQQGNFQRIVDLMSKTDAGRNALLAAFRAEAKPSEGEDNEVRDALLNKLVSVSAPQAREALIEGLASSKSRTVTDAIRTWLSSQGGAGMKELEPLTNHKEEDIRVALARELSRATIPAFAKKGLLTTLSKDQSPKVRKETWSGLGSSWDPDMLEVFEAGMNDADDLSQYEAARGFADAISKASLDGDEHSAERKQLLAVIERELGEKGAAARGLVSRFGSFKHKLLGPNSGDERVVVLARALIDSENPKDRAECARQGHSLGDKAWFEKVAQRLKSETDSAAAAAEMQSLASAHGGYDKSKELDLAQRRELITSAMRWLSNEENSDPEQYGAIPARNAADLIAKLGEKDDQLFSEARKTLGDAIRSNMNAAAEGLHSKQASASVRYAIKALTGMKAKAESDLVLEAVAKVKHDDVKNEATIYLENFSNSGHLPAVLASSLRENQKDQIKRKVSEREGTGK